MHAGSAWAIVADWPRGLRISLGLLGIFLLLSATVFVGFLIVERGKDVQIGPFKATRPETPHERNCRLAAEEVKPWFQNVNGEILAIESQVATKSRTLRGASEVHCSASHHANDQDRAWPQSLCKTETSGKSGSMIYFAIPEGDYETALTSIASERRDLQSRIEAKEKERTQRQQSWDQRCLGNPQTSNRHPGAGFAALVLAVGDIGHGVAVRCTAWRRRRRVRYGEFSHWPGQRRTGRFARWR